MIRQRLIFFIGLWVALLPFLGFPKNFRTVLFVLTGLGLIAISYFMYIQIKAVAETSVSKRDVQKKSRKKKTVEEQSAIKEVADGVSNEQWNSNENVFEATDSTQTVSDEEGVVIRKEDN